MSKFKWRQKQVEKKWVRVGLLGLTGFLGWAMLYFHTHNPEAPCFTPDWNAWAKMLKCYIPPIYESEKPRSYKYFIQLVATLPTLLLLWYFRTYDARQAIAKADAQIQQSNLVSGLDKLIQDDAFVIEVGTSILIEVSKETDEFNKQIRNAFVERLNYLSEEDRKEQERIGSDALHGKNSIGPTVPVAKYVRQIFRWLIAHPELGDSVVLNYQVFLVCSELDEVWRENKKNQSALLEKVTLAELQQALDISEEHESVFCK